MTALPHCEIKDREGSVFVQSPPACVVRRELEPARKWEMFYRSDAALTGDEDRRLRRLLFSCFSYNPFFLFRRFCLERPAHRWLARNAAGQFVGHAAVHEKVIATAGGDLRIGGVAEVCVAANFRGQGIVKALLHTAHDWMESREIPFAMLFGWPRLYISSGYSPIQNEIHASNSLARLLIPRRVKPMVKELSPAPWPLGPIDLRGPTF